MSKFNIVYKITNLYNLKTYIGCHQTDDLNDGYMGSGAILKKAFKKYGIEAFKKDILFTLKDKEEMFKMESELVNEAFIKRPDTYNVIVGGKGFNSKGLVSVISKDKLNKTLMSKADPRYNVEYFPITKGKVLVKHLETDNKIWITKDDPRYNVEYFPIGYNSVIVKDKNGKKFRVDKDDPRYLSGDLISMHKNTITAKDKDGNFYKISKDDPRYLSGELVPHLKGTKLSKDHREKISKANKIAQSGKRNSQYGTCWINKEGITKKIKKENLDLFEAAGWKKGRKLI